ncbi:MAG: hypothetical protein Q7R81_05945 [Candidatus Peregrinibacteria bacterium]|nr:hypothetical protein [Candidatus Peregrinibacteria bacterium]
MLLLAPIVRPLMLPSIFLGTFVPWYFLEMPVRIVTNYFAYARAFIDIFSFTFLIRTLFSPWKGITDRYPSQMLRFGEVAQTFALNMVSRIIGFLFRIIAIAIGIAVEICLLLFFAAFLALWLAFPIVFVYGSLATIGSLTTIAQ